MAHTTHGLRDTAEYNIWKDMRRRCKVHPDYAGRGISIHPRWSSFADFYADMGSRPSNKHSIDRIDNDGNYEPGNCQWATRSEQARNRRSNRPVTIGGKTQLIEDWAAEAPVDPATVHARLRRGWDLELALTSPRKRPGRPRK